MSDNINPTTDLPIIKSDYGFRHDKLIFDTKNGSTLEFIKFIPPNTLEVWENKGLSKDWTACNTSICKGINVIEVEPDILRVLNVWDNLSEEIKQKVTETIIADKKDVVELMSKARASRKQKYPNLPKELTCVECKCTVEMAPSLLAKKIEKSGILAVDYIAKFKCKRCNPPVRGRKPNPALAHLPTELACKCGNKINVTPSYIVQRAKIKNITPEEFVKKFVCQCCNPTKGRGRKKHDKGRNT